MKILAEKEKDTLESEIRKEVEYLIIGKEKTVAEQKSRLMLEILKTAKQVVSVEKIVGVYTVNEVNIIRDDGTAIHFNDPEVLTSRNVNTYAISGQAENKLITEMLPGILCQLSTDGSNQFKMLTSGCGEKHQNGKRVPLEIQKEMNMFVGNLSKNIDEDQLIAVLSPYTNVISAFIVKKTFHGLKYGFVSVPTDDVNKIMDLNHLGCYLPGRRLIFRPSRRYITFPGEKGFVRQPLPDRDYNLSPYDPIKTSIHVLVDDVLIKILEYLTYKERILCELVCRRWQALLYVIFERTMNLNLRENCINQNIHYMSKAMLSKMLLLTGETLRFLTLSKTDAFLKKKVFLIIAQLCPNLEYLDVSYIPDLYFSDAKALKDCKNLTCFSAKMCIGLKENSFKELISVLPSLKKLDVSHTNIEGYCFNLFPEGLKELNISFCSKVSKNSLRKVSKGCKNLEVLEIEHLNADKHFLEELAANCSNLRSLKLSFPLFRGEVSKEIKLFTKLKCLKIVAYEFELSNIADTDIEELHIEIKIESENMIDFGKFSQLKNVVLICNALHRHELMSLENCRNLQYVTINKSEWADEELIERIIKGCLEIRHIKCPEVGIDIKCITNINEIMKDRLGPIKMSVDQHSLDLREFLESQYDTNKIEFNYAKETFSEEDSDDDFSDEEEYYDSEYIYKSYDSEISDDERMSNYMFYRDLAYMNLRL
ncbi:unnamed protein product [Meganyctiphanes norvegica]|uniref:Transcription factor BTF3 n=1 Tax=Meganyctiphanes norvegica TaxID=48144 RepID=A0AAV2QW07_MEGNR